MAWRVVVVLYYYTTTTTACMMMMAPGLVLAPALPAPSICDELLDCPSSGTVFDIVIPVPGSAPYHDRGSMYVHV